MWYMCVGTHAFLIFATSIIFASSADRTGHTAPHGPQGGALITLKRTCEQVHLLPPPNLHVKTGPGGTLAFAFLRRICDEITVHVTDERCQNVTQVFLRRALPTTSARRSRADAAYWRSCRCRGGIHSRADPRRCPARTGCNRALTISLASRTCYRSGWVMSYAPL
jgi:hypothetical protein